MHRGPKQLLSRYPSGIWFLPPTLYAVGWVLVHAIDTLVRAVALVLPLHPAGLCACSAILALLTLPQQHCLTLRVQTVRALLLVAVVPVQYSAAVLLSTFAYGHWVLCWCLCNLALTVYCVALTVCVGDPLGLRKACWGVYTKWAALVVVPQACLVLMRYVLLRDSQECFRCFPEWL